MKFRNIAMMALAFLSMDKMASQTFNETKSTKQAFKGTLFENVNIGNNPIYHPTKSQQIKRKRLLARKNK